MIAKKLQHIPHYIKLHGMRKTVMYMFHCISDLANERVYKIDTAGEISVDDLGIQSPDAVEYSPIPFAAFKAAMAHLPIPINDGTFVDFGAGKGRVLVQAGTYSFRRVIGIELNKELVACAGENIQRAAGRTQCEDISIQQADATEFTIPPEVSFVHFFNPFRGETLSKVMSNLVGSLSESPRQLAILFANPDDFERILEEETVIPQQWIVSRSWVPWRWFDHSTPKKNSYCVYHLDSRIDS